MLAAGSFVRATALVMADEGVVEASAPEGTGGFALRVKTPEVARLFLHALQRFAVDGCFFVPRAQTRALAGVTVRPVEHGVLAIPLEYQGVARGALVLEVDECPMPEELRYLRAYAEIAGSIVAHEETITAAKREARQSDLLALINERTRKSLDRDAILRVVVEDVRKAFDAARCIVVERNRLRRDLATIVALAENRAIEQSIPDIVPLQGTWFERVFAGSVIVRPRVGDAANDAGLVEYGVKSALIVPFLIDGKVESAMALHFAHPRAFDDVDLMMLRSVAFHVGLALANVRLFQSERQRRSRAEALERVVRTLRDAREIEETLVVFAASASHEARLSCALYAFEGEEAVLRVARAAGDAAFSCAQRIEASQFEALQSQDVLGAPDLPEAPRLALFGAGDGTAVALRVDGELWGFAAFFRPSGEIDWDDAEQRGFVRTLVAHLELSLATAIAFGHIARLARALAESSEFKDDLMAMLAHDFRGPLTVIAGYCELLLETSSSEGRTEVEAIFSQTQRLVRLSEDAVALAQTQAAGFSLNRTVVDLREFVGASVASHDPAGKRLRLLAPDERIAISLDTQRFGHVLDNVLMNALKYSGSEVSVNLSAGPAGACIEVRDRGIGIPPGELSAVFTRFGRASNARRKGIAGSGVGLYVARKIVEVHGGAIDVSSVEDQGSTFSITLPFAT